MTEERERGRRCAGSAVIGQWMKVIGSKLSVIRVRTADDGRLKADGGRWAEEREMADGAENVKF